MIHLLILQIGICVEKTFQELFCVRCHVLDRDRNFFDFFIQLPEAWIPASPITLLVALKLKIYSPDLNAFIKLDTGQSVPVQTNYNPDHSSRRQQDFPLDCPANQIAMCSKIGAGQ